MGSLFVCRCFFRFLLVGATCVYFEVRRGLDMLIELVLKVRSRKFQRRSADWSCDTINRL